MFTIDEILSAYKKVKSGADFPQLIQDLKTIGVTYYEHNVADGQTKYYGANNIAVSGAVKYPVIPINNNSSVDKLKTALSVHQQGQTDYLTFCKHAADAGIEKWITQITEMTVTYIDKEKNKLLVEAISKPQ